jgi:hypothetical protein
MKKPTITQTAPKTAAKPAPKATMAHAPQPVAQPVSTLHLVSGLTRTEHDLVQQHPLYPVMCAAIAQAMWGKGERHGGDLIEFTEQPWAHYAKMHGRGFLTGQAAKKLEEAASTRSGMPFEQEMLGAMVYTGMAVLTERMGGAAVKKGGAA